MANYDQTGLAPSASPDASGMFVLRGIADFRKQPVATGDKVKMLVIPPKSIMVHGRYKVVRAGDSASAIDVGFMKGASLTNVSSANSIANSLNLSATGNWTKGTAPLFKSDAFKDGAVLDSGSSGLYIGALALKACDNAKVYVDVLCTAAGDAVAGS